MSTYPTFTVFLSVTFVLILSQPATKTSGPARRSRWRFWWRMAAWAAACCASVRSSWPPCPIDTSRSTTLTRLQTIYKSFRRSSQTRSCSGKWEDRHITASSKLRSWDQAKVNSWNIAFLYFPTFDLKGVRLKYTWQNKTTPFLIINLTKAF